MIVDLHTHTTASDGHLSPKALVAAAAQAGVQLLSVTDHDTVAGLPEAQQAAESHGVTLIPGIELSCRHQGRQVHIVGLNIDIDQPELRQALASQAEVRQQRAEAIDERLQRKGMVGVYQKAKTLFPDTVIGRPHLAQAMITLGYVNDAGEAFKLYLGVGKAGDIATLWPEAETAIQWIHQAKGYAVLAHPLRYRLSKTRVASLIDNFASLGGDAVEIIAGQQDASDTRWLARITHNQGLQASVGSDFHGFQFPWQKLGQPFQLPEKSQPEWLTWLAMD